MRALHTPLHAEIEESLAAAGRAIEAGDANAACFGLLGVFASVARNSAQTAWTLYYDVEDRDEKMSDVVDMLVFTLLQLPLSQIYPEFPGQAEGVLRDAFDDEHLRLEDPLEWAAINDDPVETSPILDTRGTA